MSNIGHHLQQAGQNQPLMRLRQPRLWEQVPQEDQELVVLFAKLKSSGSPNTFRRYIGVITRLLMWLDKPLTELNSEDMRGYQEFLQNPAPAFCNLSEFSFSAAKDQTVDDTFVVIGLFCTFLNNEGTITNNPAKNVPKLQRGQQEETKNFFTPYKWQLLHDTLDQLPLNTPGERNHAERLRYCIQIGYGLALRPDEQAKHHRGQIYKSDHGHYKIEVTGKGNKRRTLPIDDATVAAMTRYLQHLKIDLAPEDTVLPFLPRVKPIVSKGRGANKWVTLLAPMTENTWQQTFKKFLKRCYSQHANIALEAVEGELGWQKEWAHLSPYALRHTRLSHLLLKEKWELVRVKDFAGHSFLSTTERYIHLGAHDV